MAEIALPGDGDNPYDGIFMSTDELATCSTERFRTSGGHDLFVRSWAPSSPATSPHPRGLIVIVHGYGEHGGRYDHVASWFTKQGFQVIASDHYCHGRSQGATPGQDMVPFYWSDDILVDDLQSFLGGLVAKRHGGIADHCVYAHSMGGAIALCALHRMSCQEKQWPNFRGCVFSGPMLMPADELVTARDYEGGGSCKLQCLSCMLGQCCCRGMSAKKAGLDKKSKEEKVVRLSNHPKFQEATLKDPFFNGWDICLRVAHNHIQIAVEACQKAPSITFPFLINHATTDQLCMLEGSKLLCESAVDAGEHTLVEHSGAHELHNEEDWEAPLKTALEFYDRHTTVVRGDPEAP